MSDLLSSGLLELAWGMTVYSAVSSFHTSIHGAELPPCCFSSSQHKGAVERAAEVRRVQVSAGPRHSAAFSFFLLPSLTPWTIQSADVREENSHWLY